MCDASDIARRATPEPDDIPSIPSRPMTPLPGHSHTLRRTISHASIDTVCPPKAKGIRRRIEVIAENLKHKSTKKKKTSLTQVQGAPNNADRTASDSKKSSQSNPTKRGRKATSPLCDASHKSEEASVLAIADRIHSGVPCDLELDPPLTFTACKSDSLIDVPLFREDDEIWEERSLPTRTLALGAHLTSDHQTAEIDIKDVQLGIRASDTHVTIWDGLQATHHVFKCRLFVRCTTHSYGSVSLPDTRRIEMDCSTRPTGSHYARLPILQADYQGAIPGQSFDSGGLPSVTLAAGIHIDRVWCKIQDDDGTWGWYRDVYVPLSPRLFDKMDYREFKLVGRVWLGESCVEAESTFGISMLLRGVDMK